MTSNAQITEPQPGMSDHTLDDLQRKPLVNPVSGLASDYLNLFNELVMMLEQVPVMPELIEDLLIWRPVSYREYFERSQLPGRHSALAAYEALDPSFRRRFEGFVQELDVVAVASVATVRHQFRNGVPSDLDRVAAMCLRAGKKMRDILIRASRLVNYAKYGYD